MKRKGTQRGIWIHEARTQSASDKAREASRKQDTSLSHAKGLDFVLKEEGSHGKL